MTAPEWLESRGVARTVGGSLALTAGLSAAHLLGFTVLSGAAFALNLRLVGATLRNTELLDVSKPARVLIAIGLAIICMSRTRGDRERHYRLLRSVRRYVDSETAGMPQSWAAETFRAKPATYFS